MAAAFVLCVRLSSGWQNRGGRLAEEPHQSLDVLGGCRQEELLPLELQSAQTQATQSDLILEFCEQGFHLFSFPLCLGKFWRVRQLPCALPGGFVHVDGKKAKHSAGALGFERTRSATFAGPDVGIGAVPHAAATIVQLLSRGTAIAVAFGLIRETLGTEEWAVLSVDAVAGPHIMSDAPLRQPVQKLPVPVGRVGGHRFWSLSLPLAKRVNM